MITGKELLKLCDVNPLESAPVLLRRYGELLDAVRAYVAQEAAREAAVAWAEAELSYSTALVAAHGLGGKKRGDDAAKALCMRVGKIADDARRAYLALRAARPTGTEGGK